MSHLRTLKILNVVFAVLGLVASVGVVLAMLLPAVIGGGARMGAGEMALVGGVLVITLGVSGLFFATAKHVAEGRWRIVQTVLAALSVGNFPFGTAYGLYALWVCWMNEETKNLFR